jgi:hypothetical protein
MLIAATLLSGSGIAAGVGETEDLEILEEAFESLSERVTRRIRTGF